MKPIALKKIFFMFMLLFSVLIAIALTFNPIIKSSTLITKLFFPQSEEIYQKSGWSVSVWSQVNSKQPTPFSKTVEYDDNVNLIAVINNNGLKYSDSEILIKKGITRRLSDLPKFVNFKWYKLESEYYFYCTRSAYEQEIKKSRFKHYTDLIFNILLLDKIRYKQTFFAKNTPIVGIDQKSDTNTPLKWENKYVGTMRYKVQITVDDITVSSYGKKHLDSGKFKLKEKVHRISVKAKSGNPILAMGFAHGNLPYYYGSNSFRWGWYGSDCAKFVSVIYRKTVNPDIGYLSTYALAKRPLILTVNGMDDEGNFLHNGKKIRYQHEVRTGDIIVVSPTPHHAGIIGEDKNRNKLLDKNDFVLHTGGKAPEYQPLYKTVLSKPNNNLKIVR